MVNILKEIFHIETIDFETTVMLLIRKVDSGFVD